MGTICHNMIFLINLVIFQTLVFQNNKEMLMQLLLEVHKTLMFSKILLKTPTGLVEFLLNRKVHMIYQKMLKIFQILTTIINKEMFFQLVISTIHKVKLILRMLPSNQEIAIGIQLCLMKKKTRRVISISIIINTITRMLKMIKKFKLVLNLKKLMLH